MTGEPWAQHLAPHDLTPRTRAGCDALEALIPTLVDIDRRGTEADRRGTFNDAAFAALRRRGILAAAVPTELGGLGVSAIHDLCLLVNYVGRHDPSVAIGLAMQLTATWYTSSERRRLIDRPEAAGHTLLLSAIAEQGWLICVAGSEAGADGLRPQTEAKRAPGGWILDGSKTFATNSTGADLFSLTVRVRFDEGDRLGYAFLVRDTPGFEIVETWDGLGMRSSASHDLVVHDCFVPDLSVLIGGPWGEWDPGLLTVQFCGQVLLLGAFLGLSERARAEATLRARTHPAAQSKAPGIIRAVAEIDMALAGSRSILARAAVIGDECLGGGFAPEFRQVLDLFREVQIAKAIVNSNAITAVDLAMTVVGGGSYRAGHPLARLARDARAGPLMQFVSQVEMVDFVGRVALGLSPS